MRKCREINWSEVIRRNIKECLKKLEEARTIVDAHELLMLHVILFIVFQGILCARLK